MNMIPLLEISDFDFEKNFSSKEQSTDYDAFEQFIKQYPSGILDVFQECLDQNDPNIKLLDSAYFQLSNEKKYLNFIHDCFIQNSHQCYFQTSINFKNYEDIIYYAERLDAIDKYLILNQLQCLEITSSNTHKNFLIKDINLLSMFVKGFLREVLHGALFFKEKPIAIYSNFDMSLPIVFFHKDTIDFYKNIAQKNDLFIRNLEYKERA